MQREVYKSTHLPSWSPCEWIHSNFTQSCNDQDRFGTLAIATFIYSQAWRSDNRLLASGIANRLHQEGGSNKDDDYGMMVWYDVLIILDETGTIRTLRFCRCERLWKFRSARRTTTLPTNSAAKASRPPHHHPRPTASSGHHWSSINPEPLLKMKLSQVVAASIHRR